MMRLGWTPGAILRWAKRVHPEIEMPTITGLQGVQKRQHIEKIPIQSLMEAQFGQGAPFVVVDVMKEMAESIIALKGRLAFCMEREKAMQVPLDQTSKTWDMLTRALEAYLIAQQSTGEMPRLLTPTTAVQVNVGNQKNSAFSERLKALPQDQYMAMIDKVLGLPPGSPVEVLMSEEQAKTSDTEQLSLPEKPAE